MQYFGISNFVFFFHHFMATNNTTGAAQWFPLSLLNLNSEQSLNGGADCLHGLQRAIFTQKRLEILIQTMYLQVQDSEKIKRLAICSTMFLPCCRKAFRATMRHASMRACLPFAQVCSLPPFWCVENFSYNPVPRVLVSCAVAFACSC